MQTARHTLCALLAFAAVGCSEREHGPVLPTGPVTVSIIAERDVPESRAPLFDAPIEIGGDEAANAATGAAEEEAPATRTTLDTDWLTTHWEPEDRIAVWAADLATGSYRLTGQPFTRYVQTADNTAVFTGDLSPMPAGRYNYLAFYPVPAAAQISGTQLTYTLPQVQDGIYRAELDVLSSGFVEGPALTDTSINEDIFVPMRHRFHALRIGIPTGRNYYGSAVVRLLIDFPREAVGDAAFDLARPEALPVLTNGSRRIDVRLQTPLENTPAGEQYAWVFVAPGEIDGPISITAVYEDGFCAETLSANVRKTMAAGRVTPINLTASDTEQPLTWLDYAIDHTQLGEAVNRMTVDIPEGVEFRSSSPVVTDGRCSHAYYGILYSEALQGAELTLHYDSAHALVTGTCTLPTALTNEAHNTVPVKAPYLLEEDFSGIGNFEYEIGAQATNPAGIHLDEYGLVGWTGTRVEVQNHGMRISLRNGTAITRYRGRIDSPTLSGLKPDAAVGLKVDFNAHKTRSQIYLIFGLINSTDPQSGTSNMNTTIKSPVDNLLVDTDAGFTITRACSCTVPAQSGLHAKRLSWIIDRNGYSTIDTQYVYIDNIRVSIAQ